MTLHSCGVTLEPVFFLGFLGKMKKTGLLHFSLVDYLTTPISFRAEKLKMLLSVRELIPVTSVTFPFSSDDIPSKKNVHLGYMVPHWENHMSWLCSQTKR
jgi:hypothetical protein